MDPLLASGKVTTPQSWNRYAYAYNNPLKYIDPDGMEVLFINGDAQNLVIEGLPSELHKQVRAAIGKDGSLKRGSLDKIKSTDENFLELKAAVNEKATIEVMTASSPGDGSDAFTWRSADEAKAALIAAAIEVGQTEEDALQEIRENPSLLEPAGKIGRTIEAKDSPSGRTRIVVAALVGETADIPQVERVVTAAHELYGHGLPQVQGKPWKHENPGVRGPVNANHIRIEDRTRRTYERNQPK